MRCDALTVTLLTHDWACMWSFYVCNFQKTFKQYIIQSWIPDTTTVGWLNQHDKAHKKCCTLMYYNSYDTTFYYLFTTIYCILTAIYCLYYFLLQFTASYRDLPRFTAQVGPQCMRVRWGMGKHRGPMSGSYTAKWSCCTWYMYHTVSGGVATVTTVGGSTFLHVYLHVCLHMYTRGGNGYNGSDVFKTRHF